jgi:hypothetical protein
VSLAEFVEQRFSLFEVGRIETLSEPAVDRLQEIHRFATLVILDQHSCERRGGAEFEQAGFLFAGCAQLEELFDRQSAEANEGKRKQLVWEIERQLAEDGARPIIFYNRFAYCWQSQGKNWTMMVNSIINNFRLEEVWLDK